MKTLLRSPHRLRESLGSPLIAVCLAIALLAAACGGSDGTSSTDAADSVSDVAESADATETAEAPGEPDEMTDEMADEPAAVSDLDDEPEPTVDDAPDTEEAAVEEETTEEPTPQPVLATTEEASLTPVVYADDFANSIQPIIADKCASCHGEGGPGASHWQINTAQDLVDTHLLIRGVVESDYMPPWPASDASIRFKDNRDLGPDQVQAIIDWSAAGAPLDVDPSTPIEPLKLVAGLDNPDMVITPPEPYAGDPSNVDDYRCLVYDPQLPDGGWITGYEFIPDQTEVVHHAIGYVIEPGAPVVRAGQRDGEDGRPGWECYGSSGLGADEIFLGWAPGQDASVMPEGAGLYLPAGSILVVQIHYHYDGDAPLDNSALALTLGDDPSAGALDNVVVASLAAPVEIPCMDGEVGPLCDRDTAMADAVERFGAEGVRSDFFNRVCGVTPADFADDTDGQVESSCEIPTLFVGATGEVVAVLGHMHEIGSWFRMTLNPGTPEEQVLLDIPDWDFDWQYNYVPEEPLFLDSNDSLLVECGWDRGRRNPALEPAYILWADGTNDEMCFATVTVRQ